MPRNEHQVDMALGNRQLLSLFFVVVVLLGVFFATGYMTGRNSSTVHADSSPKAAQPLIVDSVTSQTAVATTKAGSQDSAASDLARQKVSEIQAAATAVTQRETPPTPSKDGSKPEKAVTQTARAESHPNASEPHPNQENAHADSSAQAGAGRSYLQLAATSKPEADTMVDVLREKGFSTVAMEIRERPGTWRVLVGPVGDRGAEPLRADLQRLGFPGNEAIRRTF